jgi:hypothetical protein
MFKLLFDDIIQAVINFPGKLKPVRGGLTTSRTGELPRFGAQLTTGLSLKDFSAAMILSWDVPGLKRIFSFTLRRF